MAKSKVRKGFWTYFFIFVMAVVLFFLIAFVVILFNPNASFLGIKSFYATKTYEIVKTTPYAKAYEENNGEESIDFSTISEINITSDYAGVTFSQDETYGKNAIYIVNNLKGFTRASNKVQFDFNVTIENGKIDVNITENTGFLFLSKDVRVIVHLTKSGAFADGVKLNVTTKSGTVSIGGAGQTRQSLLTLKNANLNVSTQTGSVILSEMSSCTFNTLKIKTVKGRVSSAMETPQGFYDEINEENFSTGFYLTGGSAEINIGEGSLYSKSVVFKDQTNSLLLKSTKGYAEVDNIIGKLNLECENGNYYFKNIKGLSCTNSTIANTPIIHIENCEGDISALSMKGAKITIDSFLASSVNISTTTGNVTLGKNDFQNLVANGNVYVTSESGDITLYTGKSNNSCNLVTTTGNIEIYYLDKETRRDIQASSSSGNITLRIHALASMSISMFNKNKVDFIDVSSGRIKCSLSSVDIKNPMSLNYDASKFCNCTLSTDGTVSLLLNNYDV